MIDAASLKKEKIRSLLDDFRQPFQNCDRHPLKHRTCFSIVPCLVGVMLSKRWSFGFLSLDWNVLTNQNSLFVKRLMSLSIVFKYFEEPLGLRWNWRWNLFCPTLNLWPRALINVKLYRTSVDQYQTIHWNSLIDQLASCWNIGTYGS